MFGTPLSPARDPETEAARAVLGTRPASRTLRSHGDHLTGS